MPLEKPENSDRNASNSCCTDDFYVSVDEFVKSPINRHSREGGSPEGLGKTGFPPSRE
jgi:hypothetical protein